ncbi:MAG: beta-hydroxyacyl-ACP dehydratase [Planctomycetes bacterium]|nr:beta-hydroxyacyl-ACP dehydratase [Planctomycetota bacterium]
MPPQPLFDTSAIDPTKTIVTREQIRQVNPHRYEFSLLDGFCHFDLQAQEMMAFVDIRDDAFWVRGHIPGRPLFPGVLMIESAAQMISYFVKVYTKTPDFVGFGGVDGVKFRSQVVPGDRLLLVGKMKEIRGNRRAVALTQGYVGERMVYEGTIIGVIL